MIFSAEENLTAVNNGMAVGKSVNMAMQNDSFSNRLGIFKIFPPLNIIPNIIADDYLL